jgi:hypothetical protein
MPKPIALPAGARRILEQARHDRRAAGAALSALPLDEQVALICESPLAHRAELLALVDAPERVIPRLPPAELCFVVKAVGLADAGWLLEHASEEQIVATFDLDAWNGSVPDATRLRAWLAAFAAAGEEPLRRAVEAVDFELLVLALRARVHVRLVERDGAADLPSAGLTIDGQFYLFPFAVDDDLEDLLGVLQVLFQGDYWFYYRLLQAVSAELDAELEDLALRWRDGRLQDLGFPPLADAKRIYAFAEPTDLAKLPAEAEARELGAWPLPVWMPRLPIESAAEHALFRALAQLDEATRRPLLFAFLALANRVAVADELPLGDAESLPLALDKAARVASLGLVYVAREHALAPEVVLRRLSLERLFVVGANLDRSVVVAGPTSEEPAEGMPPRAPVDPTDPNDL